MSEDKIQLFEGFTLDLTRGCLLRRGEPVHLRPQSYEVLKCLVEKRGRLISKDELIEEVWQGRAVTDGSLSKCIEEVREALGDNDKRYIQNVPRRGYIFGLGSEGGEAARPVSANSEQIDIVRMVEEEDEREATALPPAAVVPRPDLKRRNSWRKAALTAAGASVITLAVAVAYVFLASRPPSPTRIEAIAVLPFRNESGNPEVEYLSDGMTESLINGLSQLPQLSIKARSTVFRYKGQQAEPQRIASELSVQAIVEGRLVQHGDDLTLYLALVDGRNGNQIWGRQYNRKLTDLLTLQGEIGRDVSRQLRARLSGGDARKLAKNYTENVEAYQLYLRGRYHVLKLTRSEIQAGISYYRQAIDIDPNYALAYVGLAEAYRAFTLNGENPPTEFLPKAKAAAQKAIEIDDALAEAHAQLGSVIFFYDRDWKEAEKQFKRALEFDPKGPDAHQFYGNLLLVTGRHAEALAEAKRAQELDPLNVRIGAIEGQLLIYAGQTDEALSKLQKTFEVDPNFWFAHAFAASAYIDKGMYSEAIIEARKARESSGASTYPTAFLGYALAKAGERAEARAVLEELLTVSKERHVHPYHIALIYNGFNEHDQTLAWLERGFEQHDPRMVFLKVERKWNNLRSDPRFQDLLRRVGLTP